MHFHFYLCAQSAEHYFSPCINVTYSSSKRIMRSIILQISVHGTVQEYMRTLIDEEETMSRRNNILLSLAGHYSYCNLAVFVTITFLKPQLPTMVDLIRSKKKGGGMRHFGNFGPFRLLY